MPHALADYIARFISLTPSEVEAITAKIPIRTYEKGHLLLREGMISQHAYFNLKGCVRMYYLVQGEEKTTFFYTEEQFITSLQSFRNHEPSTHFLECMEDCELAVIPYEVEQELLTRYPKLESFSRIILEQELGHYQEMLSTYILSSPEQRYVNLMNHSPHLLQRVPLYQLASYIGVTPESLSRIRNRLTKNTS